MDLDGVRTFVAACDQGQLQAAADSVAISQQAASKRVAALERFLCVRLLTRGPRGVVPTVDGQALLPHARELLRVEDRAIASVTPGRRALRVDVLNLRIAPAIRLQEFYRSNSGIDLDIVTLDHVDTAGAVSMIADRSIDATFRTVFDQSRLPVGLVAERVIDDAHQLMVGPRHPLADCDRITLSDLVAHPVWMPALPADTDWGRYYRELADTFGVTVDTAGPNFGNEALLAEISESSTRAMFVGANSRYVWPAPYALRRIPIVDPTPVYPICVVWSQHNDDPALGGLLSHLRTEYAAERVDDIWIPPNWAAQL